MGDAENEAHEWRDVISLIATWRAARRHLRHDAVARRLDELTSDGNPVAMKHVAARLVDVAGVLTELYADCLGTSFDAILLDAAAVLNDSDGQDTAGEG
jgi:hypothetical protein